MPELTDDDVVELARAATGRPDAGVARWWVCSLGHRIENMTTHALDRLQGALDDGTPWSIVGKALHPASQSPAWAEIPEEHHAQVLHALDWLDESRVYRSDLHRDLPSPLRLPAVHRIDESDTCITIWREDVDDTGEWDLDRYHRTAVALGALAARWPEDRTLAELAIGRRSLDSLFFGKVTHLDLTVQSDDAFWADPSVAAVVDDRHRDDLFRLAAAAPELLARVATLPHGLSHGDAAPDNLLEPGDGAIVAIDWSYGSSGAVGCDLGQLLAGGFESGTRDAATLPAVADAIFDGYLDGMAASGVRPDPDGVRTAWATHLAVRSVFSALLVDHRPDLDADGRQEVLARRAALARVGLDLAASVLDG